jgi:hypothetical protein
MVRINVFIKVSLFSIRASAMCPCIHCSYDGIGLLRLEKPCRKRLSKPVAKRRPPPLAADDAGRISVYLRRRVGLHRIRKGSKVIMLCFFAPCSSMFPTSGISKACTLPHVSTSSLSLPHPKTIADLKLSLTRVTQAQQGFFSLLSCSSVITL